MVIHWGVARGLSTNRLIGNNNGYRYGQDGNAIITGLISGKLSDDVVIAL